MKLKRTLSMLLCGAMVASLAGCAGGSAASSSAASSAAPSSSSAASSEAASSEAASSETAKKYSGTITINTQAGTGAKEAWQAVADAYKEKQPNVNVVIDLKPEDGYADWLVNMFNSKDQATDIANINLAWAAAKGKDINFMDYANNTNPYTGEKWTDGFNFKMQSKDLATNTWDNISLDSVQVLWCYNKDIFKKVGVEPPTTWAELITVCEKLQKAGYQPLAIAGDFDSFWAGAMGWLAQVYTDQTTRSMVNTYRAQKGDYDYDPAMDGVWKYDATDPFNDDSWVVNENPIRAMKAMKDGTYKADSDGMKTVWTNFAKVFPKYAGGKAFFGTKDAKPLFYQAKAPIYLTGAWTLAQYKRDMDDFEAGKEVKSNSQVITGIQRFNLGTFNMPSMEGTGIEAKARTIEVSNGFIGAVKKDQEHNDMVVDFLMYWSSKEGQSKYLDARINAGGTPNGPSLVNGVELPAEYADMFSNLSFIGNVQKGWGVAMARGACGDVQQSLRDWYNYSESFLNGEITVDQWASKHKDNINKYFTDSLKAQGINASDLDNPQNAPTGQK